MAIPKKLLESLKKKLLKKRKDILSNIKVINERIEDSKTIESFDDGDKSVSYYIRDYVYQVSTREYKTFVLIEKALKKIEEGRYGICENCGKEISHKRLEAIPWAEYCIDCQELKEKGFF